METTQKTEVAVKAAPKKRSRAKVSAVEVATYAAGSPVEIQVIEKGAAGIMPLVTVTDNRTVIPATIAKNGRVVNTEVVLRFARQLVVAQQRSGVKYGVLTQLMLDLDTMIDAIE